MKKTIGLILLFLILAAITWFVMNKEEGSASISNIDKQFSLEDEHQVDKIFIADRSGQTPTTLQRDGKKWILNEQYQARTAAVDLMLDAVKRMRVKHLVPATAMENLTKNMAADGLLIQMFDAEGKKIKGFYLGGMTNDERGTYMALEGSNTPYVMHIPTWEGNLRQRFSLKGNAWRDRSVFAYDVEEISMVSIEYPKQKNQSFVLTREGENYKVVPFYEITPKNNNGLKRGIGESFLVNFRSIVAENFENNNPKKSEFIETVPFCIIKLKDTKGTEREVKLFPIFPKDEAGNLITNGQTIDRYFAATSEGDFMLVQHRVFNNLLWGYQMFFKES